MNLWTVRYEKISSEVHALDNKRQLSCANWVVLFRSSERVYIKALILTERFAHAAV